MNNSIAIPRVASESFVNKSKLVDVIAERRQLPRKRAEAVVDLIFDLMTDALKGGERIEVRGFGSFEVRHYDAYQGRNPRSGEPIQVAPKKLPFFKVGKELRARVDSAPKGTFADTPDDDDDDTGDSEDGAS